MLKYFDKTALEDCILFRKSLKGLLPSVCSSWFQFSSEPQSRDTRWVNLRNLLTPFYSTTSYGGYSIVTNAVYICNNLQSCYPDIKFY